MDRNFNRDEVGRCQDYRWERIVLRADDGRCVRSTQWVNFPCTQDELDKKLTIPAETKEQCGDAMGDFEWSPADNSIRGYANNQEVKVSDLHCNVPIPDNVVCLSKQGAAMLFDALSVYGGHAFSNVLCALTLVCLVLYFVTSSDSGSFVVDIISANGLPEPPLFQRIFWAVTEGAAAIALLLAGRSLADETGSLVALQSASMVTGLPYTFVLCWCCQSLVLLVWEETGELAIDRKAFNKFIIHFDEPARFIVASVAPFVGVRRCVSKIGGWPGSEMSCGPVFWAGSLQVLYHLGVACIVLGFLAPSSEYPVAAVGWSCWIGYGLMLGAIRTQIREKYHIMHGDMITDIICGITVPWFTISQMTEQIQNPGEVPQVKAASETEMKKMD